MLTLKKSLYPKTIDLLPPRPSRLFYAGEGPEAWLRRPKLAVVGSRRPTAYGQETTKMLVTELARAGVVIISGLALGIDSIAHRATLSAKGTTVAVLPSGLDHIYPRGHQILADEILKNGGGLLSEYPTGTHPHKHSFVARNRLIAGFSDGVLITEAALGSGSLHTAGFGLDAGVPVMAVPGSIYAGMSAGTNQLIKNGAHLIESAEDVLMILGLDRFKAHANTTKNLPKVQADALRLIKDGVVSQEELAVMLKRDAAELASSLTMLEMDGYIRAQGAGQWVAI